MRRAAVLGLVCAFACGERSPTAPPASKALEPPPIPIGLDAYREFRHMYRPKLGVRTYMRATYDHTGGNEAADASHFLRSEAPDFNVVLDVAGPGILYFARANHWHGSPWSYVVDGQRFIVSETSTDDPLHPVAGSVWRPENSFPSPLTYTWAETRGADLSWVPIAFQRSFTLAYGRTHYGTGYFIYQSLPLMAAGLSQPLRSWSAEAPDRGALALLSSAGADLTANDPGVASQEGSVSAAAGQRVQLAELRGPSKLVALKLTAAETQAEALEQARLRIYWDDQTEPAVEAPLPLFFGTGNFYNRTHAEWLVKALLFNVQFSAGQLRLASYFPMPFQSRARIEIEAGAAAIDQLGFELRTQALDDPPPWAAYFHASYRDHPTPEPYRDLVLLDTAAEQRDYCGNFVGMSFTFSDRAELSTLEGDPRFFFDDSNSPQGYGSGTEEWAGGGDYWGGENVTLPLAGHPVGAVSRDTALDARDQLESAYRLLLADAMPFGKNLRVQLEHGGTNESTEHYRSLVYWYGLPSACLVQTDSFHVGDPSDESAHAYVSTTASEVESITSRYELGFEPESSAAAVPITTDTGRWMRGNSEFTLQIRPDNHGVLLRRKLDYAWPDQRAQVFVAPEGSSDFRLAGVWYLAGSNRCVFSFPLGELDPPNSVVQVSNRRFREDEFVIAAAFTRGEARLRVRIVFDPPEQPLVPDMLTPDSAWSELRYTAYAWLMPVAP